MDDKEKKEVINDETIALEQEEEAGLKQDIAIPGDGVAACC